MMNPTLRADPTKRPSSWRPADFPRDTLVYAFGALAESILREAMNDHDLRDFYERWVLEAAPTALQPLVATGDARGTVSLVARAERDEFCLRIRHLDFEAVIPVGFDFTRGRLEGVFVADFRGSVLAAIAFARRLAFDVRHTARELQLVS